MKAPPAEKIGRFVPQLFQVIGFPELRVGVFAPHVFPAGILDVRLRHDQDGIQHVHTRTGIFTKSQKTDLHSAGGEWGRVWTCSSMDMLQHMRFFPRT